MFPNSYNKDLNNKDLNNKDLSDQDFSVKPINDGSKGVVLNLETLSATYSNLLVQYNKASKNYISYLKQSSNTPCGRYGAESTGISQACYNYIWQNANCTTQTPNVSANSTLDSLIENAWQTATQTDYNSREKCYGNSGQPYTIIGVGVDGLLYSRQGLDGPWTLISDNTNGCIAICTINDGQGLLGVGGDYNVYQKTNYLSNWASAGNGSCCVTSVAMGQDGMIVGVGLNNVLWSKFGLGGDWNQTSSPGEWVSSVCIAPDGSIFVVGGGGTIWKKNSYLNLSSQQWQYVADGVIAMTIAPDGTFIGIAENQLYTKANYQDMSSPWQGPYNSENSSCCVIGIATVANPNYNASDYNTTSQANFNIDQPLTAIKGQAFWGSEQAGTQNVYTDIKTVGECQALCSNTDNCTGATFNPTAHGKPMCWLRSGEGQPIPGLETDNAIIPQGKNLLNIMENINQQLIDINGQILHNINNGQPAYNNESASREQKAHELLQNYKSLQSEREKIVKMVNDYENVNQADVDGNIMINTNYYSFVLLFALVIACIFILYKFSSSPSSLSGENFQKGGELGGNVWYIIFLIIISILLVYYYSKVSTFISTSI